MRSKMKLPEERNLKFGVGIADYTEPIEKREYYVDKTGKTRSRLIWHCEIYTCWYNMLSRCYNPDILIKAPYYKGCSVSKEWLRFSVFKKWYLLNYPKQEDVLRKGKRYHLDKDLLVEGNKVYSEDTCVFLPFLLNTFLTDRKKDRGDYKLGVTLHKSEWSNDGMYRANCSNPFEDGVSPHLGLFKTEEEAHLAWRKRKFELLLKLLSYYTLPDVAVNALIRKYKV